MKYLISIVINWIQPIVAPYFIYIFIPDEFVPFLPLKVKKKYNSAYKRFYQITNRCRIDEEYLFEFLLKGNIMTLKNQLNVIEVLITPLGKLFLKHGLNEMINHCNGDTKLK